MRTILFFFVCTFTGLSFVECFEEIFVEISFAEEQSNGTLLLDLKKAIPSLSSVESSEGYQTKFVRPCSSLYVDRNNSFYIRSLRIDREEVCPHEINCSFVCHLFLQKQQEIKLMKLKVNIEDINDHQPRFAKKFYFYNISRENLHVQLEEAEDQDSSPHNGIQKYYLNHSNETDFPFTLNYEKENHLLELLVNNDKIQEMKYLLELIVVDGENERDHCFLHIQFSQKHFSSPHFDSNLYQFFIFNFNQTFIGQVHATNPSSLTNSSDQQIFYRLIPSNDLFFINEINGNIFWKNLQEIPKTFYEISVEAFYLNYISSLTTVHIFCNFTSPSPSTSNQQDFIEVLIPKLFHKNPNEVLLKENSSVPLTILQLFISFSSSPTLQMQSSVDKDYFHLKQLDEQSFELILLRTLDFELIQQIDLNFTLHNSIIHKSITIFIQNINDCPPHFLHKEFFFTIEENNLFPFHLHTFQAFDPDHLDHITFHLDNADQHIFSINSTTGQLWILHSLDREFKSNYSFLVCAFDQIYRTCSSITLDVLDQNDNVCQFNTSTVTLFVDENLPSNTHLLQLQASDPDLSENGTLFYSFSSSTPYLNIDSSSGLIQTTTTSFDYELLQFYSIIVISCDHIRSSPSFCCSFRVNININDLDDHLPYLIFPTDINQIFIIDFTNQTMPQLQANDRDLSPQHRLIFFDIVGGSLQSSLSITNHSGQLHLLTTPSSLPLYGTLHISISSQTIVHLTLLIHHNQTNAQLFLRSLRQQSFLFAPHFFYFIPLLLCLCLTLLFLVFYFYKRKSKLQDDRLMATPSTTTLSARSISTSNNKKLYETYYSFGDSFLSPQVIHL